MFEIQKVLNQYNPKYHFFGHTGKSFESHIYDNGITVLSKMSDFEWDESDRGKSLKDGCFGLLE